MRRLITLGISFLMAYHACADGNVRRVWDFASGFSEETLLNLRMDASSGTGLWKSNNGKEDGLAKTYYQMSARDESGEIYCDKDGERWILPETEGLTIGCVSDMHVNIVEDGYDGPCLWINGALEEDYIIIPQVPAGETITITYGSHKSNSARGFTVATEGVDEKGSSEEVTFTTMEKTTVELENNNNETVDVKLQATVGGMHFYYIRVGYETDTPKDKVAYLYDSGYPGYSQESDIPYMVIANVLPARMGNVEIVPVDVAGDMSSLTRDSLSTFMTVVVSGAVRKDNPFVTSIKDAIDYVPMFNLSPNLYEAWGCGNAVSTDVLELDVDSVAASNVLFKPANESTAPYVDDNGKLPMFNDGPGITGYIPDGSGLFGNDTVLATAAGTAAVHMHSPERNAYIMIPYPAEMGTPNDVTVEGLITNAVVTAAATKQKVIKTPAPSVDEEYHHKSTVVSFSDMFDGCEYYYTTDGSEPTTAEGTLFTEPFTVDNENVTVKVIACKRGYLPSDVTEKTVTLHELLPSPSISYAQESGKTVVTITPADPADEIYYNYVGSGKTEESAIYLGPLTLTRHASVTAFVTPRDGYLQSETVTLDIPVKDETVRIDVVSHMDANKAEWAPADIGSTRFHYYTTGYNFYTDEIVGQEEGKTPDGLRDTLYNVFAERDSLVYYNPGNGWEIKTRGEAIVWEVNEKTCVISDGSKTGPASVDDVDSDMTGCCLSFETIATDADGRTNPASAYIQSTEAFQGPFDIITFIGSKIDGRATVGIYVSTDTTDADKWVKIGEPFSGELKRQWKKNILSYEGQDKVFVKLASQGQAANIYDIYIKNASEKSAEYTGITEHSSNQSGGTAVSTTVYDVSGKRLDRPGKGLNIIRSVYSDGRTTVRKVVIR